MSRFMVQFWSQFWLLIIGRKSDLTYVTGLKDARKSITYRKNNKKEGVLVMDGLGGK